MNCTDSKMQFPLLSIAVLGGVFTVLKSFLAPTWWVRNSCRIEMVRRFRLMQKWPLADYTRLGFTKILSTKFCCVCICVCRCQQSKRKHHQEDCFPVWLNPDSLSHDGQSVASKLDGCPMSRHTMFCLRLLMPWIPKPPTHLHTFQKSNWV